MWYFSWVLGLGLAVAFGILNGMWHELHLIDSGDDGRAYPKLVPKRGDFLVTNLFTDFKRHDLGPAFHERNYDGTIHTEFMTAPLWGVGSKAPYGHDGRSVTLEDVIEAGPRSR